MDFAGARRVMEAPLDGVARQKWHELHESYANDARIAYPCCAAEPDAARNASGPGVNL